MINKQKQVGITAFIKENKYNDERFGLLSQIIPTIKVTNPPAVYAGDLPIEEIVNLEKVTCSEEFSIIEENNEVFNTKTMNLIPNIVKTRILGIDMYQIYLPIASDCNSIADTVSDSVKDILVGLFKLDLIQLEVKTLTTETLSYQKVEINHK